MKKKIVSFFILGFLLNACMPLPFTSSKANINYTNNGNISFTSIKDIASLCNKNSLDQTLDGRILDVARELNLPNPDAIKYSKDSNKFNVLSEYNSNKCDYVVSYADFVNEESFAQIATYELKEGEKLKITEEIARNKFKDFIKNDSNRVVDNIVKGSLEKIQDESIISNNDLIANESANYALVARPVIRTLHFADKKQILDYDFSAIFGMDFKLVKIQ